jgi:hypothetical protein
MPEDLNLQQPRCMNLKSRTTRHFSTNIKLKHSQQSVEEITVDGLDYLVA